MQMFKATYALIYSVQDKAGTNIANILFETADFVKLSNAVKERIVDLFYSETFNAYIASFKDDIIYLSYVDKIFDVKYFIYLSRHSSMKKIKSLTVHYTGNISYQKGYGANPRELSFTYPPLTKALLLNLRTYAKKYRLLKEYEIVYEATHHGPTSVSKPLVFIEIGSSEEEWTNETAGVIVANSIIQALKKHEDCIGVIGIGGGHYSKKHTKHAFETKDCYSHIFSKHVIQHLDYEVLKQALQKTLTPIRKIVVEKKGVKSKTKLLLLEFSKKNNLEIEYI